LAGSTRSPTLFFAKEAALRAVSAPLYARPGGKQCRRGRKAMAKKNAGDGVYRVIDVIGTSKTSWEDAAKNAVETASKSLRDLRIATVTQMDLKVDNGKVVAYRTRVQLSFKYEG
jgi:flavin-binding protein dodecin